MRRDAASSRPRGTGRWLIVPAVVLASGAVATGTGAETRPVPVSVYAHTGLRLADIVWTGTRFLYVENTTNVVWAQGSPRTKFASMPNMVEETRCARSPGAHGFAAGAIYCHSPDNVIYRIGATGAVSVFARLPDTNISDGALAFDRFGAFGFRVLAATGRSGSPTGGGTVYAVDASGAVGRIGAYSASSHGGADGMTVAPPDFGTGARQIVLTVDAGKQGALVLMDSQGRTRQIATLPDGPNPIVALPSLPSHSRLSVRHGLYVTDTNSTNVFFTPAAALTRYAGDLLVGTEIEASFWVVAPQGRGFRTRRIPLTPPGGNFNLEGATYVG
jgi:hypothetical protein